MIQKVVIILILIILLVLLASSNKEYFHELTTPVLTESTITTQANQCDVLGGVNEDSSAIKCFTDYNPNPEDKDYILARCIKQHTTSLDATFMPGHPDCQHHRYLSQSSGCKNALTHFWQNIETLRELSDISSSSDSRTDPDAASESLSYACSCRYELDSSKPPGYDSWHEL